MLAAPRAGGSRLLGVGAAQPTTTYSSDEIAQPFGKDGAWIEKRTGIRSLRRVATPRELRGLAHDAATKALAAAGMTDHDIDLVVTTSCSIANDPTDIGTLVPDVAPTAARMHLNSACSGFCYALSTADSLIRNGSARTVLVVAAEQMSALVNPEDLGTSIVFGDGAGAAVLTRTDDGSIGIGPAVWGSDGSQAALIECGPSIGGRLQMVGRQVFRWAVERMPDLAQEACARAGVTLADIEVFVPHQANLRITEAIIKRLGLGEDITVADSITTAGNTSAASIPIAIADLAERGRTKAGQLALLVGFGAGLSYAAQVVVLP